MLEAAPVRLIELPVAGRRDVRVSNEAVLCQCALYRMLALTGQDSAGIFMLKIPGQVQGILTTRLPSPWKISLLWPSADARVLPTLRDSPADSEVTVCRGHLQSVPAFHTIIPASAGHDQCHGPHCTSPTSPSSAPELLTSQHGMLS